jgi:hypothetical protein
MRYFRGKFLPMRMLFFLAALVFAASLTAQRDSSLLLAPERLMEGDIQNLRKSRGDVQVISATRTAVDRSKQPYSIWVATADDIARNGFITLADVLRAAPGIQVSQPGNAVEGEMFLVRGLSGNRQMKILINDVPIKPFIVAGMPIGAQLPIRQAERIEVMYGPAGTTYGMEACAGVINIILKETERPVYTQADLSFGLNYSSMDLMFGGKLGSDKNILRYSLYGSNTVRERLDIFGDRELYDLRRYTPLGLGADAYANNPNYIPDIDFDFLDTLVVPKRAPVTQESRLFGLNLAWRGFRFNYNRMVRSELNALGQSPLALGYNNPSNRSAERQETYALSRQRIKKRRTAYTSFLLNRYVLGTNSSSTYLLDRGNIGQILAWRATNNVGFSHVDSAFALYSRGERFSAASTTELRLESKQTVQLYKRLSLDAGVLLHGVVDGYALRQYNKRPIDDEFFNLFDQISPTYQYDYSGSNSNFWGQMRWAGDRLYANLAFGLTYENFELSRAEPTARAGLFYQIDSTWSARGNFGNAVNLSSPFHYAQSYKYSGQDGAVVSPYGFDEDFLAEWERVQSAELALRRKKQGGMDIELVFFRQQTQNLVRNGLFGEYKYELYNGTQFDTLTGYRFGYFNTPGKSSVLNGIQLLYKKERVGEFSIVGGGKERKVSSRAEFFVQYAWGNEWFGYGFPATKEVLNMPKWHTQFRMFFKLNEDVELMLASNRRSSVLSKAAIYKDYYQLPDRPLRHPKYRSWDMMLRFFLSKQFTTYIFMQNVFNKKIYGLDASGSPDDLIYNPQPGRFLRLGVNYNMN